MIRRTAGADWLLIAQADHAAVAARLAGHVGGRRFASAVLRRESFLAAVSAHDDGWLSHDDSPALDDRGRPLDVLDAPYAVALAAWSASTAAATAGAGPYAGLIVSLHSLSLSIRAIGADRPPFRLDHPQAVFAVNQFQHREIERQQSLREAVGLPTDIPLTHGLADAGANDGDDLLAYHFRLLQAMDLISLCLCCTPPPAGETQDVLATPGGSPRRLQVARDVSGAARVRPWPFDVARLELTVPCRRLPARPFADVEAFRSALADAPREGLPLVVRP